MLKCTKCGWTGTEDELGGDVYMFDPRCWCPECGTSDDNLIDVEDVEETEDEM